ncbi:hypothetical protein PC128_g11056 [Phytophthora cactorum]|nr:hypothetical protein PC128_g11056 [Phytophthora cactorum]
MERQKIKVAPNAYNGTKPPPASKLPCAPLPTFPSHFCRAPPLRGRGSLHYSHLPRKYQYTTALANYQRNLHSFSTRLALAFVHAGFPVSTHAVSCSSTPRLVLEPRTHWIPRQYARRLTIRPLQAMHTGFPVGRGF